MNNRISKIPNDVQDRSSEAWLKLCEYVEELAANGKDEFIPREYLGDELFAQIYTLPESIAKLKKVKKIGLYGSSLKRIPPEIGEMEALEYFDVYTSYHLHWLPYELTKCKNLKDSRISTRVLFGNYKNRMGFPKLHHSPVRYHGEKVNCSICSKQMNYADTNQMWISLNVATDIVPLLVNLCSETCKDQLPSPPPYYVPRPHKGGASLEQPTISEQDYCMATGEVISLKEMEQYQQNLKEEKPPILRLIRKIWE